MFPLCLCGFPPGSLVSTPNASYKTQNSTQYRQLMSQTHGFSQGPRTSDIPVNISTEGSHFLILMTDDQ